MSRASIAWLGLVSLGLGAFGCAPGGDHEGIETKQGAVTAVLFKPFVTSSVGSNAFAVATGDLNGDGRTDVAITTGGPGDAGNVNDDSVHVFLQAADGSLLPRVVYKVGRYPQSIDIGDVNGDGRADVVVGNSALATSVGVLLQNASGTLAPMVAYPTVNAYSVKIGDFNSDGRMDVASINWGTRDDGVDVFLQTASGTLAPQVTYHVAHGGYDELDVGDVDGDGRTDIIVMSGQSLPPNIGVLPQLADGTMGTPVYYGVGPNLIPRGVAVGDSNGDGLSDIVVSYGGNRPTGFIARFLQNGSHTLDPAVSFDSYDIPSPVVLADVDGDGRKDVLTVHDGWQKLGVYRQTASGGLATEELYTTSFNAAHYPQGLAVGDINGDSLPDVVMADELKGLCILRHVDDLPPTVAITAPTAGASCLGPQLQLTWTASDNAALAGFDVTVSFNGGASFSAVSGCTGMAATARACTFTPASSGAVLVRVTAKDTSNNKTQAQVSVSTGSPTVVPDHASYAPGAAISVAYSCLPGNVDDWIALARAGTANTSYLSYVVTGGNKSGTATFQAPTSGGSYVIRAFPNNTYTLLASAPFSVPITIGTDAATYDPGTSITVTYSGLPGNADDWIALAPAGSANTSYVSYALTGGNKSGTVTLHAPASGGSYVVRAFPNNTFNLLAEASFSVTATPTTVSTDATSYAPGASITVTYSNLPGNVDDWLALAPANSANTSYLSYVLTGGNKSGTATFQAPASGGSYVIRVFPNNTYNLLVEAAFSVTAATPTVSADAATYAAGASITLTYSGLPGNADDWIAVAPANSPNTTYLSYALTGGNKSGTATLHAPASGGSYVIRAFPNNTYNLLAETSFSVTATLPTLGTNATTYDPGASITVTYSGLPGNADDWIALAPANSPNTTYLSYVLTGGNKSGTATLQAPASGGSYVIRAFPNNTYNLLVETSFSVTLPTVSTDATTYDPGATITVTYSGLPGNADDWIALAPAGSPNTSYLSYVLTGGNKSGTATLQAPASGGSYVVRLFPNNTYSLLAEAPFSVPVAP